jgi:hypothetical protein
MEWWSISIGDFRMGISDRGQFTGTAEAQRAQRKPNEDSLTSKK